MKSKTKNNRSEDAEGRFTLPSFAFWYLVLRASERVLVRFGLEWFLSLLEAGKAEAQEPDAERGRKTKPCSYDDQLSSSELDALSFDRAIGFCG